MVCQPFFNQKKWSIVIDDVTWAVLDVLNNGTEPSKFNSIFLCLMPKIKKPKHSKYFFPGHLIINNGLVAFDIFRYMKKKTIGQKGFVGMKLDMAKAYDRVEWEFLKAILVSIGFLPKWIELIWRCISTTSFSILLNGIPCKSFKPSRGLRQGDHLSLYLFIVCAEVFFSLLICAQNRRAIHSIKNAQQALKSSHLFFADGSILFIRATHQDIRTTKDILQPYQKALGECINLDKLELSFSRNLPTSKQILIQDWLGINVVNCYTKYMGLPTFVGHSKK